MKNRLYILYPEVAGQLGKNTILHNNVHPPRVDKLHYKFDGWLGDDIIESFPFICTKKLTEYIFKNNKFNRLYF